MVTRKSKSTRSFGRAGLGGTQVSNEILNRIPAGEFELIRPHLKFIGLSSHLRLNEADQKIENVYFPNSGMISLVIVMSTGRAVEVGVTGREGFAGAPSAAGVARSPVREIVQVAGEGYYIPVKDLRRVMKSAPLLDRLLSQYSVLLAMQMAQTAACNRLHHVERRLSRWLLMTEDRVQEEYLAITHDFLAEMLGTDRPSVSLAAARLQRKGLIQYKRAAVKIISRAHLELASCECYAVVKKFNRQLGLP
jgi:CRP-like cAMP-binding protein